MDKSLNTTQKILLRLLRKKANSSAINILKKMHSADIAGLFYYLTDAEKKWLAKNILNNKNLAKIVSEMDEPIISDFFSLITKKEIIQIIEETNPDDGADIILAIPKKEQKEILKNLSPRQRAAISKLLGFKPDTAGGIMTTDFLALNEEITSYQAIEKLKKQKDKFEIFYIYVIDNHNKLVGVISYRELVLSEKNEKLKNIMNIDPISIRANKNQEESSSIIAKYNLLALPVVDEHHELIGQITVDDAIDVLYEEATEDIYHLANIGKQEHISASTIESSKMRTPWLMINLIPALLAAYVISMFEEIISKYIFLAFLMPIVANMGGNAGIQSLTVVVRSIALGEIDLKKKFKVVFKEIKIGLFNGLIMGITIGIIALIWYKNINIGLIMFFSMIINLIIAGLFGASIPLILKKMNLDPALGSSIFVTAAADIGGFIIFLGIATTILKIIN